MATLKNVIFFLVTVIICVSCHSCGNVEQIAELGATIDSVQQQINHDSDVIYQNKEAIVTFENSKKVEYTKINSYDDSRDLLIPKSPIAAAYIVEFYKKDTITILKEYFQMHSFSELLKLAIFQGGLAYYYSQPYGHESVRILLDSLLQLDSLKKGAVAAISAIENKVQKLQAANGRLTQEIGGLTARKNELQTTLNALK